MSLKSMDPTATFRAHLEFMRQLFPQPHLRRLIANTLEELDELETITEGNVFRRVFRAIDEGHQRLPEIAKRIGVDQDMLKPVLAKMVATGVLKTEEQGGKTEEARGARKLLYVRADLAFKLHGKRGA